ncbi:hypothetical protein T11_15289 [Trichinella zimbabwensis]|uniref:DUF5641 domain-containing protein n=1 Tax=Trichinella zimbabwensis TaxID=268475 RepID=A0A0V1I9Z2_9BILA|nr:hypothetical protein T11_15289 [Trichinella zimbabwensis]
MTAKLVTFVRNSVGIRVDKVTYWSDSEIIVLDKEPVDNVETVGTKQSRHYTAIDDRGSSVKQLISNPLWWYGPELLIEERGYCFDEKELSETNLGNDPERFENFERLLRVTAYCIRFLKNCRLPECNRRIGSLALTELQNVENSWIRRTQQEHYCSEIQQLSNRKRIATNSRLLQLDPFLDENGLVKIHGRLQRSDLPESTKHPLILPDKHPVTTAIAPLPADRIKPTRPFENTGLDLAGPLFIRHGKSVMSYMTALRLIEALRRFIARRGRPRILQSDNFRSFKQLIQELRQLFDRKAFDLIEKELSSQRMHWKIITERAPWMGGYWERLIRFIKIALVQALPKALTKDPEVLTPYHFLTGTKFLDLPEVDLKDEDWLPKPPTTFQLRKSLKKYQKWHHNRQRPRVEDVVLIAENNVSRNKWKMGKIVELYFGQGGIARIAKLKTAAGMMKSLTANLYLIEPSLPWTARMSEILFAERRLTWRIISRNDNDRESPAGFIVSSDLLAASDGWYVLSVKLVKLWSCDPARGRRRMMRGSESSHLLLERCCG